MFEFLTALFERRKVRKQQRTSTASGTGHVSDVPAPALLAPLVLLPDACEPSRSNSACEPGHSGSHDSGSSSGDSGSSSDGGGSCD
ncbi:hypothetical protein ACLUUI_06300 [Enterobacterales bacterium AW_CKDN230030176-1A_HGKHYDSX7]